MSDIGGIEIDAKELMKQFDKLPDRVARRVSRKAVNYGSTPVIRAIRERVQKRTGLTKKSIGRKTVYYKNRQTAVAVIGSRQNIRGENPDGSPHAPFNIFHLLDRGHIAPDGSFVPGSMAVEEGSRAAESQALDRMHQKLAQEIEREAQSL